MPYTDEQRRNIVVNAGHDPNAYDFDEASWKFVPKQQEVVGPDRSTQPFPGVPSVQQDVDASSTQQPTQSQSPSTSKFGAFAANAAFNVLPSMAAVGVGTPVGIAGSELSPFVGVPAGIAAGMGAGSLVSKMQEKMLPQSALDYLARARKEHNIASAFGDVAGGAVVARPSVEGAKTLGSGLVNLATGLAGPAARTELTQGQLQAILNSGINAGVPAAMAGIDKLRGGEVDPAALGIQMLGGAASTTPTSIGKRLGLHSVAPDAQYSMMEKAGQQGFKGEPIQAPAPENPVPPDERISGQSIDPEIKRIQDEQDLKNQMLVDEEATKNLNKQAGLLPQDEVIPEKTTKEEVKHEVGQAPNLIEEGAKEPTLNDQYDLALANQQKPTDVTQEDVKLQQQVNKKEKDAIQKQAAGEVGIRQQDALGKGVGEQNQPEDTGGYSQQNSENQAQEKVVPYPFFQQVKNALYSQPATKNMLEYFKKLGGDFRNFKVQTDDTLADPQGNPVRGVALVKQGVDDTLIKLSAKDANAETLPHEAFHAFWNYLDSVVPTDTQIGASKIKRAVAATPEFQEFAKAGKGDVEEFLAHKTGQAAVRKLMETDQPFRSGIRDAAAGLLSRLRNNPDDYARLFARKLLLDPKNEPAAGTQQTGVITKPQAVSSLPEGETLDLTPEKFSTLKSVVGAVKPAIDKVAELGPTGKRVAEGLTEFQNRQDEYEAKFIQKPITELGKAGIEPSDIKDASEFIQRKNRNLPTDDLVLSAKAKEAVDILTKHYQNVRAEANKEKLMVFDPAGNSREGKISPYYWPEVLNDNALRVFTKEPESARAAQAKDLWAEHAAKASLEKYGPDSEFTISKDQALKGINDYLGALSGTSGGTSYGALNRVKGYGIPEALRETDPIKVLNKYGRRASKTLAYWKELQSKPDIAGALKLEQPNGLVSPDHPGMTNIAGATPVVNAMKFVTDEFPKRRAPLFQAIQRVFTNMLLGPVSGAKDVTSVPFLAAPYLQHVEDIGAFGKALQNFKQYAKESLDYGSRSSRMDYKRWNNIFDETPTIERLNNIADAFRKYQGRDLLEQVARIFTHGLGVELGKLNLVRALAGDEKSVEWLKNFSSLIKDKPINEWGQPELAQVGKNFTDRVQGTYDSRGLPAGMFDHPVASTLFPLQRWSVERFNNVYKDVIQPAKRGDLKPLLLATLGASVGGKVVGELAQALSGKKQHDPTISEAVESGNKEQEVATVVALMQMGSYMGIAGDIAKTASDAVLNKRPPQLSGNPVLGGVENLVDATVDAKQALDNGESPVKIMASLIPEFLVNQVQSLRILRNHLMPEDTQGKEDSRDLSVYRRLQGTSTAQDNYRPMQGVASKASEREFDAEDNPQKAAQEAQRLVQMAMESSKGPNGQLDIQKLTSKLRALKDSSEAGKIFPAQPQEQSGFLNFLNKTQGQEEAQRRVRDWMKLKALGEFKSGLIPTF